MPTDTTIQVTLFVQDAVLVAVAIRYTLVKNKAVTSAIYQNLQAIADELHEAIGGVDPAMKTALLNQWPNMFEELP